MRSVFHTAVLLAIAVLATQTFVALGWLRPVVVSGDSMAPTLVEGRRLLVRRHATPRRWDVVVARSPADARRLVIKRVVGLPGEEVTFRRGEVWADGRRRNAPAGHSVYYGALGHPTWRLGPEEWFLVGDNQAASVDSRHWGPAPSRLLVGVVAE